MSNEPEDPEDLIRALPPESAPPEIVRAALRVFRYRAIAALAVAIAILILGIPLLGRLLQPKTLEAQFASALAHGSRETIAQSKTAGGVNVLLWEVVVDADTAWIHLEAWDPQNREFSVQLQGLDVAGHPQPLASGGGGGGCCSPSTEEEFDSFKNPVANGQSVPASATVQVLDKNGHVIGGATFEFTLYGGEP